MSTYIILSSVPYLAPGLLLLQRLRCLCRRRRRGLPPPSSHPPGAGGGLTARLPCCPFQSNPVGQGIRPEQWVADRPTSGPDSLCFGVMESIESATFGAPQKPGRHATTKNNATSERRAPRTSDVVAFGSLGNGRVVVLSCARVPCSGDLSKALLDHSNQAQPIQATRAAQATHEETPWNAGLPWIDG